MMMPRCKSHTNMPRATCAKPTLAQQPLSQSRVIVFGVPVLTAWLADWLAGVRLWCCCRSIVTIVVVDSSSRSNSKIRTSLHGRSNLSLTQKMWMGFIARETLSLARIQSTAAAAEAVVAGGGGGSAIGTRLSASGAIDGVGAWHGLGEIIEALLADEANLVVVAVLDDDDHDVGLARRRQRHWMVEHLVAGGLHRVVDGRNVRDGEGHAAKGLGVLDRLALLAVALDQMQLGLRGGEAHDADVVRVVGAGARELGGAQHVDVIVCACSIPHSICV